MTSFRVEVTRRARRDLKRSPRWVAARVAELVESLRAEAAPRGWDVAGLEGMDDVFRVRIGDFRVVYRADEGEGVVTIIRVAPRGEAYGD